MVKATGINNLPSKPPNVIKGANTKRIINVPDTTGPATSRTALKRMCNFGKPFGAVARRATLFSTTTTDASTNIPIAIANPPKLIRFADISNCAIRIKVTIAAIGKLIATARAARASPKNKPNKTNTSNTANISAVLTVLTARSTK